jgi:hypothetical protein
MGVNDAKDATTYVSIVLLPAARRDPDTGTEAPNTNAPSSTPTGYARDER